MLQRCRSVEGVSRVGACACTALGGDAIPTATRALAGKARIIEGSLDFVGGRRNVPGGEKGEPATHNEEYREYYNYGQTPHLGLVLSIEIRDCEFSFE